MSDMLEHIADNVKQSAPALIDAQAWMEAVRQKIEDAVKNNADMGELENLIARELQDMGRSLLAYAVQKRANNEPLQCPDCRRMLNVQKHLRERNVNSQFGPISVSRSYGYCAACKKHLYPSDRALGLQDKATASPRVQEICALMVLESPAGQAEANVRRLTGVKLGQATMHREARRQGERALRLREADEILAASTEGVEKLAARSSTPSAPHTLVIEIDAWNIRERDFWGETEKRRVNGDECSRWHWVYTGTVFRLDQRGKSASGRAMITERGYVATRRGLESFEKQIYAEALQRGLLQAKHVLVLADGAVWIWNLADNIFHGATQRVDLWHIHGHLWDIANDLYGQGSEEAKQWVRPLLQHLKKRENGAFDVIENLQQLRGKLSNLTQKQAEHLEKQIEYLKNHQNRMDYKKAVALNQPLGSGAIESTCAQYQCRFKRTGQFWSIEGDETFLALSTLHRNGRWHLLFPHDRQLE